MHVCKDTQNTHVHTHSQSRAHESQLLLLAFGIMSLLPLFLRLKRGHYRDYGIYSWTTFISPLRETFLSLTLSPPPGFSTFNFFFLNVVLLNDRRGWVWGGGSDSSFKFVVPVCYVAVRDNWVALSISCSPVPNSNKRDQWESIIILLKYIDKYSFSV